MNVCFLRQRCLSRNETDNKTSIKGRMPATLSDRWHYYEKVISMLYWLIALL